MTDDLKPTEVDALIRALENGGKFVAMGCCPRITKPKTPTPVKGWARRE